MTNIVKPLTYICDKSVWKQFSGSYGSYRKLCQDSISCLYTSIIEPHMTYCVEVWGNAYEGNPNPMYLKQKFLIRLITKSSYLDHRANLFQSFNLPLFFI